MSYPHDTVSDRAKALVAAARVLVESSRVARATSGAAQSRARLVLAGIADRPRAGVHCPSQPCDADGVLWNRRTGDRRLHERLVRPGRRHTDRRGVAAEQRRVLLVGPDDGWRKVTAYMFEEAGYVVHSATDSGQALSTSRRLLPDVVLAMTGPADALGLVTGMSEDSNTQDIPVVVLTASLQSSDARRAREAGAITLLAHPDESDVLVGEVDTLVAVAPRAQRILKRRLLDLRELARHYTPDAEGQTSLRRLIDRLQVAIFAVDRDGHCIAASRGATTLTGYSRLQLLTASVFQAGFAGGNVSTQRWQDFLASRAYAGTTTITNRAGADVAVHAAAVAEILPGLHVAAFVAVTPGAAEAGGSA
jgi:PAS domain S-box-containing protein